MTIKSKFFILILIVFFINCSNNSAQIKPPNEEEIAVGIKNIQLQEAKLNSDLRIIKDLNKGIIKAQKEDKPILLIFSAFGAINARKLESEVILKDEGIFNLMRDNFINVWLYVDDRTENGKKWSDLQAYKFKGNHQPHIFILDSEGNKIDGGIGYKESKNELLKLLEKYKN